MSEPTMQEAREAQMRQVLDAFAATVRRDTLAEVRKMVEGLRRDTAVAVQDHYGTEHPTCIGCGVPTMYFQCDGHACEPHNALIDRILHALTTMEDQ